MPRSTLIGASVSLLPPPGIHQDSIAPHSSRPAGWAPHRTGSSFIPHQSLFTGHLPCARHCASLWTGPLAIYPMGAQPLWIIHTSKCCEKSDPFHGLKVDSYLTLGNELSEETHVLTKQENSLGSPQPPAVSRRVREPKRTALPHSLKSRILWWWDSFWGCLWPIILKEETDRAGLHLRPGCEH